MSPGNTTRFRPLVATAMLLGLLVSTGAASAERETIDLSTRGPQIGENIPEFVLPDQNGNNWTAESILGENGTMLVFIRSANW